MFALVSLCSERDLLSFSTRRSSDLVVHDGDVIEVAAHPTDQVVDTTGAGDLYAAGFLYGLTQGKDLAACGALGSMAATAVLGHTGPRPDVSLAEMARQSGL